VQFESLRSHLPEALQGVVTFAYITGWRVPSEVRPLEWRQVDFEAGTVRLDPGQTKNGDGRLFPMTTELRELLQEQDKRRKAINQIGGQGPRRRQEPQTHHGLH
jgi:integrase